MEKQACFNCQDLTPHTRFNDNGWKCTICRAVSSGPPQIVAPEPTPRLDNNV